MHGLILGGSDEAARVGAAGIHQRIPAKVVDGLALLHRDAGGHFGVGVGGGDVKEAEAVVGGVGQHAEAVGRDTAAAGVAQGVVGGGAEAGMGVADQRGAGL